MPAGTVVFLPPAVENGRPSAAWYGVAYAVAFALWSLVLAWTRWPVLGAVAAAVWLELGLMRHRVVSRQGRVVSDAETAARVAPPLLELCARTRCSVPRVMLRSDSLRVACVRPVRGGPVLVLSLPFVRALDDGALRALLAHEVAHLSYGDLAAARNRWRIITLPACMVGGFLGGLNPAAGPLVWAGVTVALIAIAAVIAPSNQPREFAADLAAARLCDDPGAVVRALTVTSAFVEAARADLLGPRPLRLLLAPVSWRPATHPPFAKRIARLEALPRAVQSA